MNKCNFSEDNRCKECTYVYFKDCPNFRRSHRLSLVKELLPFKGIDYKGRIRDVNYAAGEALVKSCAAKTAISLNTQVKRVTLQQVLYIVVSHEEFIYPKVLFIECTQKPMGEPEKIMAVLTGFIGTCELRRVKVFILSKIAYIRSSEWNKLEVSK